MTLNEQRKRFVELTKSQLIGINFKGNLLIGQKPLSRFFTGFLFPIIDGEDGLDGGIESEESTESNLYDNKEEVAPVKKVKRYIPPILQQDINIIYAHKQNLNHVIYHLDAV